MDLEANHLRPRPVEQVEAPPPVVPRPFFEQGLRPDGLCPRGMVFTELWPKVTPARGGGGSKFGLATASGWFGVGVVGFLSVSSATDSSSSDNWSVANGEYGLLARSGWGGCDAAERSSHPSTASCVEGGGSWELGVLVSEGKYSVMGFDP